MFSTGFLMVELFFPAQKVIRQSFQCDCFAFEDFQRSEGAIGQLPGQRAGFLHSHNRGVSGFLRGSVFASGFAELLGGLRDVEDVVDDLERESDVVAEIGQRLELGGSAIGAHAAQANRAAEQCGSFSFVDVFELRGGSFFYVAVEIRHHDGLELQRTGRFRDFQNEFAMPIARPALALRGDFKGLREQRVAREHSDAFAENFVVRRFATAKIVVVHRGQVIVDKRIGMDAFDGAGERQGVFFGTAASFGSGQQNGGAHPFASSEKRVTHRLVNGGGPGCFAWEKLMKGAIDGSGALLQKLVEGKGFGWSRHRAFL